jgi:hypothetical protein
MQQQHAAADTDTTYRFKTQDCQPNRIVLHFNKSSLCQQHKEDVYTVLSFSHPPRFGIAGRGCISRNMYLVTMPTTRRLGRKKRKGLLYGIQSPLVLFPENLALTSTDTCWK